MQTLLLLIPPCSPCNLSFSWLLFCYRSLLYLLTYCFSLHSSFHRLYIIVFLLCCPLFFFLLPFFSCPLYSPFMFSPFLPLFLSLSPFLSLLFFSIIHSQWEILAPYTVWCCPSSTQHPSTDLCISAVGGGGMMEILADIPPQWICWVRMVSLPILLSKLEVCGPVHKALLTWLPFAAPLVQDSGCGQS